MRDLLMVALTVVLFAVLFAYVRALMALGARATEELRT